MIAIDTNVLVYAHRAETALHQAATRRLVAMAEGGGLWGLRLSYLDAGDA